MFREIMGAEEEKEVGPIKSLKKPKIEPGQVGNIVATSCDYKLPEDHVKKFVERKKKNKKVRTPRPSRNDTVGRSSKQTKVLPKPSAPLREHSQPVILSKEEIAALKEKTNNVPKPTTTPIFHSPKFVKMKGQGSKSRSNGKVSVNALRESKLLKEHNEQLRKNTRTGPTVQKLKFDAGAPVKYSTTMEEYRAREKIRRAKARRSRRR